MDKSQLFKSPVGKNNKTFSPILPFHQQTAIAVVFELFVVLELFMAVS